MANVAKRFASGFSHRYHAAIELGGLGLVTPLFLLVAPHNNAVYLTMAVLFVGLIFADSRLNPGRFWPHHPGQVISKKLGRSAQILGILTLVAATLFLAIGLWLGHPIVRSTLPLALLIYLPWALLQQYIFQHFLLGRLRTLLPKAPPLVLALLNGLAYSLVHLPALPVTAVTALAGTIWSYLYQRERCLLAIAVSHAVLGTTFYYWVVGSDLVELTARMLSG